MWAMSVYNQSTATYVIDPRDCDWHESRDAAKRDLQEWLIAESNDVVDDEDTASMLDDAAQALNYAEWTSVGGVCSWTCETVEIA